MHATAPIGVVTDPSLVRKIAGPMKPICTTNTALKLCHAAEPSLLWQDGCVAGLGVLLGSAWRVHGETLGIRNMCIRESVDPGSVPESADPMKIRTKHQTCGRHPHCHDPF